MRVLRNAFHAVSSVFGCQHDRLSRPFTIEKQSYMVCLECGHKLYYSMTDMRPLSRREVRHLRAVEVSAHYASPKLPSVAPVPSGDAPSLAA